MINLVRSRLTNLKMRISSMQVNKLFTAKMEKFHWLVQPAFVFILSRFVIYFSAYIGSVLFPTVAGHWKAATTAHPLVNLLVRWDSQWYNWIVEYGYWLRPGQRSNIAFFPLYPLIVKTIKPLFGNSIELTSIVVSNAAFFAALTFFYKLTLLEFSDRSIARRAIFYLAIFPTSFYFSSMYTESLFLLFTISTFYFARRHLWNWAALMGVLASATRIVGVLTWGFVMWEWMRSYGWSLNAIHRRSTWRKLWKGVKQDWLQVVIIGMIPLGLLSYMLFLQLNFRDPLAFFTVQSAWNRQNIGPLAVIVEDFQYIFREGLNQNNTLRLLNQVTFLGSMILGTLAWKRLGAGYSLYVLLNLLVPASSNSSSILRYALVCFPVFMVLGTMGENRYFDRILTICFSGLLVLLTAAFATWIFVA